MFQAILLICSFAQANDCIKFIDTRSLHETKEGCIARIYEMQNDLEPLLPNAPQKFWYKCDVGAGLNV